MCCELEYSAMKRRKKKEKKYLFWFYQISCGAGDVVDYVDIIKRTIRGLPFVQRKIFSSKTNI